MSKVAQWTVIKIIMLFLVALKHCDSDSLVDCKYHKKANTNHRDIFMVTKRWRLYAFDYQIGDSAEKKLII